MTRSEMSVSIARWLVFRASMVGVADAVSCRQPCRAPAPCRSAHRTDARSLKILSWTFEFSKIEPCVFNQTVKISVLCAYNLWYLTASIAVFRTVSWLSLPSFCKWWVFFILISRVIVRRYYTIRSVWPNVRKLWRNFSVWQKTYYLHLW